MEWYLVRSGLTIHPNPATSLLVVSLPDSPGNKIISLYHAGGRLAEQQQTKANEITFQVDQYSRVLYLIKVITDKSHQTARFVKE